MVTVLQFTKIIASLFLYDTFLVQFSAAGKQVSGDKSDVKVVEFDFQVLIVLNVNK